MRDGEKTRKICQRDNQQTTMNGKNEITHLSKRRVKLHCFSYLLLEMLLEKQPEKKMEGKEEKRQREDKAFVTFLFIQPKHSLVCLSCQKKKTDMKTKRNETNIKV